MKVEGIKTPCRCKNEQCAGRRLTQLHLYAQTDDDVETLQLLFNAIVENADGPIQSTDVVVPRETILPVADRVKIAIAKNN